MTKLASHRIEHLMAVLSPSVRFFTDSPFSRHTGEPGVSDFAVGNPHEPVLPEFVAALQRQVPPRHNRWYAYPESLPEARAAAAKALSERRGVPFAPEDVLLTNGAFVALAVALHVVTDPGDEVIFISPPWFFYEGLIVAAGAVPVRVRVQPGTFDLDLGAIAAAITPRTSAIIVNSPNNPTGVVYSPETLTSLSQLLAEASARYGRDIALLSDESYWRIVYDGRPYHSPTAYYPNSLLIYTYGKTLLTPGQRLGYIALPPGLADRERLRTAFFAAQLMSGYAFPNALLQHALPELEDVSVDVAHLQRKRDRMLAALRGMGYELHSPQGTFYLLPRSPLADDWAFAERLAEKRILVLPGSVAELPGYFRLSLTATDEMIQQALPGFAAAIEEARRAEPAGR